MGLFDKLFGTKSKPVNLENSRLFELLDIFQKQDGAGDSYDNVVLELMHGNSFLLLPSANDNEILGTWITLKPGMSLNLTSIFNLDGLKVLAAFTDEKALLSWAKKPVEYTKLSSQDVLMICEFHLIERIVIDSDLPTMFVLEKNQNIKRQAIEHETTVLVGMPERPLEDRIIQKLIEQFKRVYTIDEVYQYAQTKNDEFSLVLAFKLSTNSDNAKTAAINAVQTATKQEKIDQLLDLFFIGDDESWYNTIRNIQNSKIYTK